MRPESFSTKEIFNYLKNNKIASMADLKKVIETNVDKTVSRKLKKLSYRSSYSHRGKYYTLDEVACFDKLGLWSYSSIYFSKYGTLLDTAKYFIEYSEAGYSAHELENILHVKTKESLLHLYEIKVIYRVKISGIYFYFSGNPSTRKRQIQFKKIQQETSVYTVYSEEPDVLSDEIKAAIILFYSTLNEKQRRHYAGLESMKLGHGGDRRLSDLLGMGVHTIAKGRRELLSDDINTDKIRTPGGGRKKRKKNTGGN